MAKAGDKFKEGTAAVIVVPGGYFQDRQYAQGGIVLGRPAQPGEQTPDGHLEYFKDDPDKRCFVHPYSAPHDEAILHPAKGGA